MYKLAPSPGGDEVRLSDPYAPPASDITGDHATRTALAIAPAVLLAGVAGGIAFPILPAVGAEAGLPLWFIGLILAANRAARVVSNPFVGTLSDRLGGRRVLIVGMGIQLVVMALYVLGVTTGHPGAFFLIGRLLHGPGSSAVFVSAQALALHAGGRAHGGRAASTVRIAIGIGIPFGVVVGGVLADVWSTARTFEAAMFALAAATVAAVALVPDLRVSSRRSPKLRDAVAALRDPRLAAVGALNFAVNFSASGMILTTLVLLVRERHLSLGGFGDKGTSGVLMGGMVIVDAVATAVFGPLGDRRQTHARIAAAGLAVLVVALVAVGHAGTAAGVVGGLVLVGIGAGALGPSLLALVGKLVAPERMGTGIGVMQLCGDVGGMLGPLVGTSLFAQSTQTPYLVSAALLACGLPVAVWLTRQPLEGVPAGAGERVAAKLGVAEED